ncbi:copper chaperone PCu(A)C [Cellulomonas triticagri]|uniref:Copper chaperone PCu(A)C n=1 Tax=Cellulomonas triticagri TaxID=2483352 RepID=A0A3M2IWS0_9CELL|nr:copper chaperone PCu(A)C [Cellulomonas triticagri]RMI04884.1 copper chaperone PCu(A)C [Cellulomonas triticagri]
MRTRLTLPALALLSALALAGCTADAQAEDPATTPATTATEAESVTVTDAWVKSAETGMSAAFGLIENTGDADVTVVSVGSPASTAMELHETVENETGEMLMREKDGGFTIAAGQSLPLEPGANHLMLMDLVEPVVAGDEVTFTLTFADDSTLDFTAPAKDYSGANETYAEGEGHEGMDMGGEMDMGDQ